MMKKSRQYLFTLDMNPDSKLIISNQNP